MTRLKQNMFEGDCRLFNLRSGQMRMDDFVHNGGWYNSNGEKIGWGDLSPHDINKLTAELEDGEDFYVLGEQDSYWKFVKWANPVGTTIDADPNNPGIYYVKKNARYLIQKGKFTAFLDSRYPKGEFDRVSSYYTKKFSDSKFTFMVEVKPKI